MAGGMVKARPTAVNLAVGGRKDDFFGGADGGQDRKKSDSLRKIGKMLSGN